MVRTECCEYIISFQLRTVKQYKRLCSALLVHEEISVITVRQCTVQNNNLLSDTVFLDFLTVPLLYLVQYKLGAEDIVYAHPTNYSATDNTLV